MFFRRRMRPRSTKPLKITTKVQALRAHVEIKEERMFTSSVRRAAIAVQPSPLMTSIATTGPRTVSTQALTYRSTHQRRSSSSSKPSSPSNGSKGIPDGQAARSSSSSKASSGQSTTKGLSDGQPVRSSRRKVKDIASSCTVKGRDEAVQTFPSVPSTHHIKGNQIAAAAFFSLHRPISVTSSFPKTVTDDAFASIFTSRTKVNTRTLEVISTLSNAVNKLDNAIPGDKWNAQADELRAAITAESYQQDGEVKHLDQNPTDALLSFPDHILSGRFQPFNPPPPPKPMNTADSLAAGVEAAELSQPQHRTYTAVLTVEESTDENGNVTWNAHSSPLVAEDSTTSAGAFIQNPREPISFRDRMNVRQQRFEEAREDRAEQTGVWAISVKRQRKLKMKKHKYKKLMRKTRNLRRRLDRN